MASSQASAPDVAGSSSGGGAPTSAAAGTKKEHKKELYPMVGWKYDLFLYLMGNLVDLFFREVVPRGSWKVPKTGPILFVAAPHANQVRITA